MGKKGALWKTQSHARLKKIRKERGDKGRRTGIGKPNHEKLRNRGKWLENGAKVGEIGRGRSVSQMPRGLFLETIGERNLKGVFGRVWAGFGRGSILLGDATLLDEKGGEEDIDFKGKGVRSRGGGGGKSGLFKGQTEGGDTVSG